MTPSNMTHLKGGFYIVRTQAGFRQAFKHFITDGFDRLPMLCGHPTHYPSVVVFSMGYNGDDFIRVECIHINELKTHMEDSDLSAKRHMEWLRKIRDRNKPAPQPEVDTEQPDNPHDKHVAHDTSDLISALHAATKTTHPNDAIAQLVVALDAAHDYIDYSDDQLAELSMSRDDILLRARETRDVAQTAVAGVPPRGMRSGPLHVDQSSYVPYQVDIGRGLTVPMLYYPDLGGPMKFATAFTWMKRGKKIRAPGFIGYWMWDAEKKTIIIVTKDNERLDLRESDDLDFTFGFVNCEEWEFYDGNDDPRENRTRHG